MEEVLKQKIAELAEEIGAESVCIALQIKGLSPSTAERLALGKHTAGFKRRTVTAVRAVLADKGKVGAA